MTTEPSPEDLAWCQAFLAEAQQRDLYEPGGELWEFMPQLMRDPALRALPAAEAVEHWRTHG